MNDPTAFVHETLNTIWNQKMVGAIYQTFASGVRIRRSCREDLYGQEALMTEVIERLAAFPDLQLTIEDLIWQGSEAPGYQVSLRMHFSGHNQGVSRYGAATNREVSQSVLMNARIVSGLFVELWLAEDERSLVEQLGYDPGSAIQSLEAIETWLGTPISEDMPGAMGEVQRYEAARLPGERLQVLQLNDAAGLQEILSALWNGRQIGLCDRFYSHDFTCHWASMRHLQGRGEYQAVVLAHLAAFPDLSFHINDVIEQRGEDGWHLALAWTMLGRHAGPSAYGRPSGKRVQITGISQYLIREDQIVTERTEWNEFRLMQKIMERPHGDSQKVEYPKDSRND